MLFFGTVAASEPRPLTGESEYSPCFSGETPKDGFNECSILRLGLVSGCCSLKSV